MKFVTSSCFILPIVLCAHHVYGAYQVISFSCTRGEGSSACIVPTFESSPCTSVSGSPANCNHGEAECTGCIFRDNGGSSFESATEKLSRWCSTSQNGYLGFSKVSDVVCSS